MKRIFSFIVCVGIIFSSIFINPRETQAYYTNMDASVVIGQQNFTSNSANQGSSVGPNTTHTPLGTLVINNKFLLVDFGNNRVLIYNSIPTSNNASADVVIGQPDFVSNGVNQGGSAASNTLSSPSFIATDGQKLFISDTANNRILIFNSIPTSNNASADVVVGQTSFSGTGSGVGTSSFNGPRGVAVYNGKLIVADESNDRVMIWNTIPTLNGTAADITLSKIDASTGLNRLYQLSVNYNGKLAVANRARNRVLMWNSIPTATDTFPDIVVGQPDFTTTSTGVGASKMSNPRGVFIDNNRLYVCDRDNSRVLIFNSIPTTTGASADLVLGQPDFISNSANGGASVSAKGFAGNFSVSAYNNKLFISEITNHRVLIFNNVVSNPFLNIKSPLTSIGEGRLRVVGDVVLGERGTYSLQKVLVDVNGQGYGNATYLSGGRDGGNNNTLYDFFHDFEPWAGSNGDSSLWKSDLNSMTDSRGYTLKVKASSFNADEMVLFYFLPFKLTSFTNLTYSAIPKSDLNLIIPSTISTYLTSSSFHKITFKLNKYQIQRIKDNIDHFEVETKRLTDSLGKPLLNPIWIKYGSDIPTSLINTDENSLSKGEITTYIPNTLTKTSQYEVRIVSVSKESAWRQYSNTMTLNPTTKTTTTLTSYPTQEPTQTQLPQETPLPTLEPLPTTTPNLTQTNNNFTIRGLMIGLGVLIPLVILGVLVVRRKLTKS